FATNFPSGLNRTQWMCSAPPCWRFTSCRPVRTSHIWSVRTDPVANDWPSGLNATLRTIPLNSLRLRSSSPARDFVLARSDSCDVLPLAKRFRHLGLEYRVGGSVGLSRDKFRKICNLFRYDFRRKSGRFRRLRDPLARVRLAVELAQQTIAAGVRNV